LLFDLDLLLRRFEVGRLMGLFQGDGGVVRVIVREVVVVVVVIFLVFFLDCRV